MQTPAHTLRRLDHRMNYRGAAVAARNLGIHPEMPPRESRVRLDELIVRRGLAPSRQQARALILAGHVTVMEVVSPKPGQSLPGDAEIVVAQGPKFVSRGGEKLAHALDRFRVDAHGRICADVGASTG